MAVGVSHVAVVTLERAVYTWGDNSKGQLGHGDFTARKRPTLVDALKGKSITRYFADEGGFWLNRIWNECLSLVQTFNGGISVDLIFVTKTRSSIRSVHL